MVLEASHSVHGMKECMNGNGTYAFVSGPNYESKSECKLLKMLGGDAVGMSTPEVAAAHHAGMAVLCLSLITNKVVMHDDPTMEHANHEEVLAAVAERGEQLVALVSEVVKRAGREYLPMRERLSPICLEVEGRVIKVEMDDDDSITAAAGGVSLCPYHMAKRILNGDLKYCVALCGLTAAAFGGGAFSG